MPYALVDGVKIFYRKYGQGFPLVLIMGLGANSDWWDAQMLSMLAESYLVVTFDNRGAGRSDRTDERYTIPLAANDTRGLMEYLGIEKAHMLGISMGGMVAQEFALSYPYKVEKLVLVCTNAGGRQQALDRPEVFGVLAAQKEGVSLEELAREYIRLLYPPQFIEEHPERVEEFVKVYQTMPPPEHGWAWQMEAVLEWESLSRLPRIECPTLVITGDQDVLVPAEDARTLAEKIPRAQLIIYPGVGHGIFGQITEKATRDILKFLSE